MRTDREPSGTAIRVWPSVVAGALLAIASTLAGALGGPAPLVSYSRLPASPLFEGVPGADEPMLAEAVANLERQSEKLAAGPGATCPHDFAELDGGRPLRVSMFWGYDEHHGRVHDRAHALSMAHLLTSPCHSGLSTCGFTLVSRSEGDVRLTRSLGGRPVELDLFTTTLPADTREDLGFVAARLEQERRSRSVKERFLAELVQSDVVFYMGHSRLGGGMGFDRQSGLTTAVNAVSRLPMRPVLEALRRRPTRLRILGVFSCDSNRHFRQAFRAANPALSLILTTGDVDYGPSEQASLGALESVLSKRCGHGFHEAMTSVDEPDPERTYLYPGS